MPHPKTVHLSLGYVGLLDGGGEAPAVPFSRRDGSPGRLTHRVDLIQLGPAVPGDPHDLPAFGAAVERLLRDPDEAERLGRSARARAIDEFLGDRHLTQYARVFETLPA